MADIIISQQADDDFERLWRTIALDNDDAADRLFDACRLIFVGWDFPVFSARRTVGSRQERPSPTATRQQAAKSS